MELKALIQWEDLHLAQGLNYLVANKVDKGLLINFDAQSLLVNLLRHPINKQKPKIPVSHKSPAPWFVSIRNTVIIHCLSTSCKYWFVRTRTKAAVQVNLFFVPINNYIQKAISFTL